MTAAALARQMMDGLSDTATTEMQAALADLSQGGFGDLVSVFRGLLDGQDMASALGLPEGTTELLYAQAHARFNKGHLSDALVLFQALTVLAPRVKDHWLGLGICLRQSDALDGARLALTTALDLSPDCAATTHHLAELALAQGDRATASALSARFAALPETAAKQRITPEAMRLAAMLRTMG